MRVVLRGRSAELTAAFGALRRGGGGGAGGGGVGAAGAGGAGPAGWGAAGHRGAWHRQERTAGRGGRRSPRAGLPGRRGGPSRSRAGPPAVGPAGGTGTPRVRRCA